MEGAGTGGGVGYDDVTLGEDRGVAAAVLDACRAAGWRLAVAESCTGGLVGARLTSVPGSSEVFVGGVTSYDDRIKEEVLHVEELEIREHGAVSGPVAAAMARGVRRVMDTDVGVAVTGIAGPGGGSARKPVGTVWIGLALPDGTERVEKMHFEGRREEVRLRAVEHALRMVLDAALQRGDAMNDTVDGGR